MVSSGKMNREMSKRLAQVPFQQHDRRGQAVNDVIHLKATFPLETKTEDPGSKRVTLADQQGNQVALLQSPSAFSSLKLPPLTYEGLG